MKKRIGTLLTLMSVALAASVISFSPKKPESVNAEGDFAVNGEGGIPIETPDSEYNPVFYAADYSSDIADEPHYETQKSLTFDHMGFNQAPNSYRGDSIKVAIIDSGINYNHEDFGLNILNGKSGTIDNTTDPGVWKYYMVERNYQSLLNDTFGHGTNVASVVASQINQLGCAGIAPNVDLYVFKVTDEDNRYLFEAINSALQYCIDNDVDVVNMSFQAYEHAVSYGTSSMVASEGCSTAMSTKLNLCYDAGITLVAAAGNYNTNEPSYPASNNHVISVGSFDFDEDDNLIKAGYSNTYGIDLVAPGEVYVATKGESNAYKQNHGTSFSAPIVTAAIALYKQQNPSATPTQIENALKASCTPITGNPSWAGSGALNIDKFLRMDAPTSISITNPSEDSIILEQGETLQIEYNVSPSDYGGEIKYVSAFDNVTISNTGLLTAVNVGEDSVSVESKDYGDVYDAFDVTVIAPQESEDDSTMDIVPGDFGTSYNTSASAIKNHTDGSINYVNVGNFGTGIQIKKENGCQGSIYNTESLGKIKSVKITEQSGKTSDYIKIGFGSTQSEAASATLVALTTSGVSGENAPYFYIARTTSNGTSYMGSISIVYEMNGFTVSFYSNGGTGSMSNSLTSGSNYTVPICNFTKTNYTFDGWALNSASGTKYAVGDLISDITGNIALYATWKEGSSPTPDPDDSYYSSITATSGDNLLGQLHTLMGSTHKKYTSYDDCKDPNKVYSTDPGSSSAYLTEFYTQQNIGKEWAGSGSFVGHWNREHVWCQSLSSGLWGQTYGGSDLQHIRPVEMTLNSTRNNLPYGIVSNHSGKEAKSSNTSGTKVNVGGWYDTTADKFEPLDSVKGDVARILMYVYMHYTNQSNGTDGTASGHTGNLLITNVVRPSSGSGTQACWNMLLDWSTNDPVSESEKTRNEAAYAIQGNRNPFIDHPEYADAIWGNTPIQTKTLSSISLSGTHKTSFDVGDTFSYNGLVVTAHYSDNSEATVTPTSVSSPDMSTAETKTITVSYTEGGVTKSATYTITVSAVEASSILLSQNSATLKIGGNVTLTATFNPTNTTVKTLTWTTSDDSIATVNNGVVTAVAPGTATITATTSNGKTDTCDITVSAPQVSDITIETSPARVRYNSSSPSSNTFSITATLTAEAGATVTWTSSNTSAIKVATGGGASSAAATTTEVTGYFDIVGTGTSTITASAGGESATCEVKATLPVKSYQAEANTSSVAYTGTNTTVSCTIYEVYTDNSRDAVEDNYNLNTNASILGSNIASGTYGGKTVMAPITVTNEGSKESITTSADASKQAEAWAIYFINTTTTTSTCKASNDEARLSGLKDVWDTLSSEYAAMADLSKTAFCSSSASDKIKEALNHYQFIISKFNKNSTELNDFVVDGSGNKPASSSRSLLNIMFSKENTGLTVVILSVVGLVAIGSFFVFRKRKTY